MQHSMNGPVSIPSNIRDRQTCNGTVGRLCAANNVPLTPCTFINSGGISWTFDRLLIKAFGADDSMIPGEVGAFTFLRYSTVGMFSWQPLRMLMLSTSFRTCARHSDARTYRGTDCLSSTRGAVYSN